MTYQYMTELANLITYKDWKILVKTDGPRAYLQVEFIDRDLVSGLLSPQRGRKWFLSEHMTRSEFVQTAFKAVLTAEEHEAREQFRYRGRMIFGPHFDVDAMVEFAGNKENIDLRTGQWVAA